MKVRTCHGCLQLPARPPAMRKWLFSHDWLPSGSCGPQGEYKLTAHRFEKSFILSKALSQSEQLFQVPNLKKVNHNWDVVETILKYKLKYPFDFKTAPPSPHEWITPDPFASLRLIHLAWKQCWKCGIHNLIL